MEEPTVDVGEDVIEDEPAGESSRRYPDELIADTKRRLSSYKVPRSLHIAVRVPRAPNGKADYNTARALCEAANS